MSIIYIFTCVVIYMLYLYIIDFSYSYNVIFIVDKESSLYKSIIDSAYYKPNYYKRSGDKNVKIFNIDISQDTDRVLINNMYSYMNKDHDIIITSSDIFFRYEFSLQNTIDVIDFIKKHIPETSISIEMSGYTLTGERYHKTVNFTYSKLLKLMVKRKVTQFIIANPWFSVMLPVALLQLSIYAIAVMVKDYRRRRREEEENEPWP